MKTKTYSLLLICLLFLNCEGSSSVTISGFKAIVGYGEGFVAAGAKRIDRIDLTGHAVHTESFSDIELSCLFARGTALFAAGEAGVLLMSENGEDFTQIESGTTLNINSLTGFQDYLIAGADNGTVLTGSEAGFVKQTVLDVKGNIVALSAGNSVCYGITDHGEIFHSSDMVNWEIFDFNDFYAGYYEPCRWTTIVVTDQQVAVAGSSESGKPVLFFSSEGRVWTNRSLDYTDPHGLPGYLAETPNAIIYDVAKDRFLLACNGGTVMVIPSCSHCNELHNLSTQNNLTAISQQAETLVAVGDDYYIIATNNF